MKSINLTKNEVKSKNIVLIITSIITLLIGLSFFFTDFIPLIDSESLFYIVMLLYFGISFANYMLTKNMTGMHYLYISLVSMIAGFSGFKFIDNPTNIVIALTLCFWFITMIIIKLIRINILRNERNYSVFVNLFSLSMFILLGILTITNIYVEITNASMMLGFFFTVNGLLDLIENIGNIKFCK